MALTLAQIQANITNNGDARQILNQIADYLEANPGGGAGVASIIAGTNVTLGGTAADPVINATGGSSYLSVEKIVTHAEMLAWVTTPVQVLAGEAGKAKIGVFATFVKDTVAGEYVTSNNNIVVYHDNNFGTQLFAANATFNAADKEIGWQPMVDELIEAAEMDNIPIMIGATGDEFTGGNAANTFTIKLYYVEIDL